MKELICLGTSIIAFVASVITMVKGFSLASYILMVVTAIAFSVILTKAINYGDYNHPKDD